MATCRAAVLNLVVFKVERYIGVKKLAVRFRHCTPRIANKTPTTRQRIWSGNCSTDVYRIRRSHITRGPFVDLRTEAG